VAVDVAASIKAGERRSEQHQRVVSWTPKINANPHPTNPKPT